MLRHELLSDKRILVLQPDGPLQAADFERVAREIDPFIEKGGDLAGLMIEAAHPPGWDNFASFATHLPTASMYRGVSRTTAAATVTGAGGRSKLGCCSCR